MENSPLHSNWTLFLQGDRNAYAAIFKHYYVQLYNYGLKLTHNNKALTEDCLQDFFINLYTIHKKLNSVKNSNAYIFISFRRALLKRQLQIQKIDYLNKDSEKIKSIEFTAEDLLIHQEITAAKTTTLAKMLNKLSAREREVIYLKYYSNLAITDIAEVMDISKQSVQNVLFKAFTKLRKNLENEAILSILK